MPQTQCPQCHRPLSHTAQQAGMTVRCPHCHTQFIIGGHVAPPPIPHAGEAVAASLSGLPIAMPALEAAPTARPTRRHFTPKMKKATSLFDIFDLTFEKYVTPLIVKITWIIILVLAALWLAFGAFVFIMSFMPDMPSRPTTPSRTTIRVGRDSDFTESVERLSFSAIRMALTVAGLITTIATTFLGVLWARMILETIIVIFHIAQSIKSLDEKTLDAAG